MKFLFQYNTSILTKARNIALGLVMCICWFFVISTLIKFISPPPIITFQLINSPPPPFLYILFFSWIAAPITEQLAFCHGPLTLVKDREPKKILALSFIMCYIFGILHGGHGVVKQGVLGAIFTGVYIKNGYCYWSSVIIHSLWNVYVYFG